jgi:hypothetical protein
MQNLLSLNELLASSGHLDRAIVARQAWQPIPEITWYSNFQILLVGTSGIMDTMKKELPVLSFSYSCSCFVQFLCWTWCTLKRSLESIGLV